MCVCVCVCVGGCVGVGVGVCVPWPNMEPWPESSGFTGLVGISFVQRSLLRYLLHY